MSEPKDKKKSRRKGSGSSLADAVVAALTEVERKESLPAPAPDAAAGKAPDAPAPTTAAAPAVVATTPSVVAATPAVVAAAPAVVAVVTTSVTRTVAVPPGDSDDPVVTTQAEPLVTSSEAPRAAAEATPAADAQPPAPSGEAAAPASASPPAEEPPTAKRPMPTVETVSSSPSGIRVRYFGRTDVGLVREHNEDNFMVADLTAQRRGVEQAILETAVAERGCVFCVCDGMGGAAAGEVASQMAVDTIHEILQTGTVPKDRDGFARRLVRAIEEAGSRIFSAAKMDRSRRGMGTTSTVAGLVDGTLFVGQVGDSRAYVLRGDQFALISKDQSLVNQLIEAGQLTEEEAEAFEHSNIILQALGTTEEVVVDLTFLQLRRGDRLLLCSDGLSGLVHADMIKEVLQTQKDLTEAAAQLISMANAGGGHDNITVVLCDFEGDDLKEPTTDARVAYQQYPLPPEPKSEESHAPRATHMKSGGQKPGADVKGEPSQARSGASARDDGEGSRSWVPLLLLGALVLLVVAAVLFASQGSGSEPPPAETLPAAARAPAAAPAGRAAPPPAPPPATLTLAALARPGEADPTLWVNGAIDGTATAGRELELEPGVYHLRATAGAAPGAALVDEETVTLGAGEHVTVDLSAIELSDGEPLDEEAPEAALEAALVPAVPAPVPPAEPTPAPLAPPAAVVPAAASAAGTPPAPVP